MFLSIFPMLPSSQKECCNVTIEANFAEVWMIMQWSLSLLLMEIYNKWTKTKFDKWASIFCASGQQFVEFQIRSRQIATWWLKSLMPRQVSNSVLILLVISIAFSVWNYLKLFEVNQPYHYFDFLNAYSCYVDELLHRNKFLPPLINYYLYDYLSRLIITISWFYATINCINSW